MKKIHYSELEVQRIEETVLNRQDALLVYFGLKIHEKDTSDIYFSNATLDIMGVDSYEPFQQLGIKFNENDKFPDKKASVAILEDFNFNVDKLVSIYGKELKYVYAPEEDGVIDFSRRLKELRPDVRILNVVEDIACVEADFKPKLSLRSRYNRQAGVVETLSHIKGLKNGYTVGFIGGDHGYRISNLGCMVYMLQHPKVSKVPRILRGQDINFFFQQFRSAIVGNHLLVEEKVRNLIRLPRYMIFKPNDAANYFHMFQSASSKLKMELHLSAIPMDEKKINNESKRLCQIPLTKMLSLKKFRKDNLDTFDSIMSKRLAYLEEMFNRDSILTIKDLVLFEDKGETWIGYLRELDAKREYWITEFAGSDRPKKPVKTEIDLLKSTYLPIRIIHDWNQEWQDSLFNYVKSNFPDISTDKEGNIDATFRIECMERYLYNSMGYITNKPIEFAGLDEFERNLGYNRSTYVVEFSSKYKKIVKTLSGARGIEKGTKQIFDIYGGINSDAKIVELEPAHFGSIQTLSKVVLQVD